MKCPACHAELDVRLIKAPPQPADQVKRGTNGSTDTSSISYLLESANARELNEWESEFIGSLQERFNKYGDRIKMSEKQMETLTKIATGETDEF